MPWSARSPSTPSTRRLNVVAVLDRERAWVEVAGQVLGDADAPRRGVVVIIRTSWGIQCSTASAELGSFAARFSAPVDAIGREIVVEADGVRELVPVS